MADILNQVEENLKIEIKNAIVASGLASNEEVPAIHLRSQKIRSMVILQPILQCRWRVLQKRLRNK